MSDDSAELLVPCRWPRFVVAAAVVVVMSFAVLAASHAAGRHDMLHTDQDVFFGMSRAFRQSPIAIVNWVQILQNDDDLAPEATHCKERC